GGGDWVAAGPRGEAVERMEHCLEPLRPEPAALRAIGPRLVRLTHALDHLKQLHDDLKHLPPAVRGEQLPGSFATGARALVALLDATKDLEAAPDPALFAALEDASKRLSADCMAAREKTLEDVALQRAPAGGGGAVLEPLGWADRALYHAWRLAESRRRASAE